MSEQDFERIIECAHNYEDLKEGRDMARRSIEFIERSGLEDWPVLELTSRYGRENTEIKTDRLFIEDLVSALVRLQARYEVQIAKLSIEIGEETMPLAIDSGEITD
jgi:hypothetical protein